jgi:hypothetical protein
VDGKTRESNIKTDYDGFRLSQVSIFKYLIARSLPKRTVVSKFGEPQTVLNLSMY